MEPPALALMDKKDKKSELLPVHTEMKKHWVPNEDAVPDEQYKDAPTLAMIKHPQHLQAAGARNTTDVTILPDSASKSDHPPTSSSLTQTNQKQGHDIYTYSTTSDKPYGDRIVELVNEFHETAEKANALDGSLSPNILKMSGQIEKTIKDGSAGAAALV